MSGNSPSDPGEKSSSARPLRFPSFNEQEMASLDQAGIKLAPLGDLKMVTTARGPRLVFVYRKRQR